MENMTGIDSASILRLSYDEAETLLEVEFHNGGIYQYLDVPIYIWEEFKQAGSKGQYLNSSIKGMYRFIKI
jgi:hypothetical protein